MKTILFYFLLTILAVSCQLKQSENTEKEVSDNVSNSDTEECIADTISATAIFWIDKAETKHCKEWGFRTVKAKVLIHENGKVDLEAFVKNNRRIWRSMYGIISLNFKYQKNVGKRICATG